MSWCLASPPKEEESLDLTQEAALADEVGTEFVRAVIDDRGIPTPGVIEQAVDQIVSARASSPGIGGGGNVRYTW